MQSRPLPTIADATNYITGSLYPERESYDEFGNIFGYASMIGIATGNLEAVKKYLPGVPPCHVDKLFTSGVMSPDIMAYFLVNETISTNALNRALLIHTQCAKIENVELLLTLKPASVNILQYENNSPLKTACFTRLPELLKLLVTHLARHSTKAQRQPHLDAALIHLAENIQNQYYVEKYFDTAKNAPINDKAKQKLDEIANESVQMAQILVNAGANVNARNENSSVLEIAQQSTYMEPLIAYLKEEIAKQSNVSAVSLYRHTDTTNSSTHSDAFRITK